MSDDVSLFDLFREEVRAQAAVLSAGLLALEAGGDPRAIEPLMRAAHSVKGAARIVNVEPAVALAHVMEDVLVAAGQGKAVLRAADVDLLLRGTDVLATDKIRARGMLHDVDGPPQDYRRGTRKIAVIIACGSVQELSS